VFVRGYDKGDEFCRSRVVHFVKSLGGVIPILVRLFVKGVLDLLSAWEPGAYEHLENMDDNTTVECMSAEEIERGIGI